MNIIQDLNSLVINEINIFQAKKLAEERGTATANSDDKVGDDENPEEAPEEEAQYDGKFYVEHVKVKDRVVWI